jgi:hypothetical protein
MIRWLIILARTLRVHHWTKNAALLVPPLMAHDLSASTLGTAGLAIASFSLLSSSVYIINDLADVKVDRQHPTKSRRPIAAGQVPLPLAYALAPVLIAAALALALLLPRAFAVTLAIYLLLTVLYTYRLKQVAILDTITIASLFTLRIVAGGAATQIEVSHWLLSFSTFFFLSLAMVKRYSELDQVVRLSGGSTGGNGGSGPLSIHGRGYAPQDLVPIGVMGIAAGFMSILVFALYLNQPHVLALYQHPERLWLAVPLLFYWVAHIWLRTWRGQVDCDPVISALRDRVSYGLGAAILLVLWIAH